MTYSAVFVAWNSVTSDMTHSYMWHDASICVTRLICSCDMTPLFVKWLIQPHQQREMLSQVTWLTHMCDMTHLYVWHDILRCERTHLYETWLIWPRQQHELLSPVTWLTYMCDMTHSHVWHDSLTFVTDSLTYVTWLTHICDMTHSHVWHDSLTCVIWLTHTCDMSHSYGAIECKRGLMHNVAILIGIDHEPNSSDD